MQEEVENRTVNFVVTTSKLSAQVLISGIRRVLQSQSYRRAQKKTEKRQIRTRVKAAEKEERVRRKAEGPRGKQSVRQLIRHSNGVKRLPVEAMHMREFEKILKKYGVDYSFVMDASSEKSRYLVFFRARDEEVLKDVYRESVAKLMKKQKPQQEQRSSVLKALAHFKAIAARTHGKARHHEQEHSL